MSQEENHLKIPHVFHSFHNEGPFLNCIDCDKDLMQEGCQYIIEKAIRNYPGYKASDTVFDYAICMDCAKRMNEELSRESIQAIQNYFHQNMDMGRYRSLLNSAQNDVNKLIGQCMIKGTSAAESNEYQIYAHCIGDKLDPSHPPYMISGDVLDEISDQISAKTRDILNGFFDRHFSPDPGLMEPAPGPRVLLI